MIIPGLMLCSCFVEDFGNGGGVGWLVGWLGKAGLQQ